MKSMLRLLLLTVITTQVLAGCGGGSSSTANSTPTPTPVAGVATPKAVSVVTAN